MGGCPALFEVPFKPCLKRNKLRRARGGKSSYGRAEVRKPGSPTGQHPLNYPHTRFNTSRYASSIFPKSFRNRSLSIESLVV
jgi:hypothetical protein